LAVPRKTVSYILENTTDSSAAKAASSSAAMEHNCTYINMVAES
jgi:hypothetical protein